MYRNSLDNTVIYSPDDIALFRESPFAAWMERLTLENPDHGILPDSDHFTAPQAEASRHEAIAATLRAEGRNVVLVEADQAEAQRQIATVAALHSGADFIVNGQLAVEPLSGNAKLLMRTSGYSELGDYLYIPCETQAESSLNSAFRLSFFAELLHELQGQLPPQMLIIRDSADVVPLQTDDYIYYYRAVQQRFIQAMESFRKHRMPDPSESSHFGRWSACASEVLKQRAQRHQSLPDPTQEEEQPDAVVEEIPQLKVASGNGAPQSWYDAATVAQPDIAPEQDSGSALAATPVARSGEAAGHTLAEQAQRLAPGSFRHGVAPGHTPNLARFAASTAIDGTSSSQDKEPYRYHSDAMLQNLEFIGSNAPNASMSMAPSAAAYQESSLDEKQDSSDDEPMAVASRAPSAVPTPPDTLPEIEPQSERELSKTSYAVSSKLSYVELSSVSREGEKLAPPPNLREASKREFERIDRETITSTPVLADLEPPPPFFLPPDMPSTAEAGSGRGNGHAFGYNVNELEGESVIDMDGMPAPTLPPLEEAEESEFEPAISASLRPPKPALSEHQLDDDSLVKGAFSSSLHTSDDIDQY